MSKESRKGLSGSLAAITGTGRKLIRPFMLIFLSTFLSILLSTLLSACGFHLRGIYTPPDFLHEITLHTPLNSHELDSAMRIALEQNNIVPHGGEVLLDITQENIAQQTSTVSSQAAVAEYTLVYTVEYRISRTDKSVVGPLQTLTLRRSYQYNTATIVGIAAEEETMIHELRIDVTQQIMRRLSTLKTLPMAPADSNTPSASAPASDATTSAKSDAP
jgi:LPS-assembly lipoprotein